jgi:hypothetical protein
MNQRTKGTVAKVIKGQYGYGVILQNQDGYYYNTKYDPKCETGDVVGIEHVNTKPNASQIKSIQTLEKGPGAPAAGGGGAQSGGRQDSIIWQSCQKVASWLVQAKVAAGALEDPSSAGIDREFDKQTYRLYKDASDPTNSSTYRNMAELANDLNGTEPAPGPEVTGQPEPLSIPLPAQADSWGEWEEV